MKRHFKRTRLSPQSDQNQQMRKNRKGRKRNTQQCKTTEELLGQADDVAWKRATNDILQAARVVLVKPSLPSGADRKTPPKKEALITALTPVIAAKWSLIAAGAPLALEAENSGDSVETA